MRFTVSGLGRVVASFSLVMTAAYGSLTARGGLAPHPYVAGAAVLLGALATAPMWACDRR